MSTPTLNRQVECAFIGFGEAAQAFVQGWGNEAAPTISAYDIKTDSDDTAAAKQADYARTGITGKAAPADLLRGAGTVFSMVTADQALVAAEAAAEHIAEGALYFDCNSCAPDTKRKAAALIDAAGARYVDAAVMAPVHPPLHKVPVLLSGPHAEAALEKTQALDMNAKIAAGPVGIASSIKMVRSIMIKGLEALVLECVLAGRRAGVDETVLGTLDKSFPEFGWTKRAAYMMERVTTHGIRRAAEMREVARTVDELGLEGRMARATVDWQQQIGDLGIDADGDDYAAIADEILRRISQEEGAE